VYVSRSYEDYTKGKIYTSLRRETMTRSIQRRLASSS